MPTTLTNYGNKSETASIYANQFEMTKFRELCTWIVWNECKLPKDAWSVWMTLWYYLYWTVGYCMKSSTGQLLWTCTLMDSHKNATSNSKRVPERRLPSFENAHQTLLAGSSQNHAFGIKEPSHSDLQRCYTTILPLLAVKKVNLRSCKLIPMSWNFIWVQIDMKVSTLLLEVPDYVQFSPGFRAFMILIEGVSFTSHSHEMIGRRKSPLLCQSVTS